MKTSAERRAITIRLSPEMHRMLRWHYAESGESMSALIVRLIQKWSKENNRSTASTGSPNETTGEKDDD